MCNYVLHKNGANFYYNKGTAINIWNIILHNGLISIKGASWINSTFEKKQDHVDIFVEVPIYGSESMSLLDDVGLMVDRPDMQIIRWMCGVSLKV